MSPVQSRWLFLVATLNTFGRSAPVPKIDLQVPFSEKDEAKRLGARWDGKQRTWYVPDGVDISPLKKWLPQPQTEHPRTMLVPSYQQESVLAMQSAHACVRRRVVGRL
jgi:hypothetical protein